jgi:hypothetical protein
MLLSFSVVCKHSRNTMRIGSVKRPLPNSGPIIVYLMDRCLVPTTTGGSSANPRAMSNPVDVADPFVHSQQ